MKPAWRRALGALGPLLGLIAAWILFASLAGSSFVSLANQRLLLEQTTVVGVAAIGATWIIVGGGIDLSVGSTIALCSMVSALAIARGSSALTAVLAGLATSLAIGALIGALINGALLRFPLSPFIVTLGAWGALRGVAKGIGGSQPIYPNQTGDLDWIHALMNRTESGPFAVLPAAVWITLVLAMLAAFSLRNTVFGRHVVAVGSNEENARLCGVRVARTKLAMYVLGVGCAGVAALFQLSFLSMGDPATAQGLELKVIAAVVIGGASLSGGEGSVFGSLVGALLMSVVDNGCTQLGLDNWVQEVVTGLIIVAAVALDRWR